MNKSEYLYSQIKDSNFNARIEKAPCMGRCNLAPVVEVNHNHICNANLEKISNAIKTKDFSYKNDDFISLDDYSSGSARNHIRNNRVVYIKGNTIYIKKKLRMFEKNIHSLFHFGEFSRIYQSFKNFD